VSLAAVAQEAAPAPAAPKSHEELERIREESRRPTPGWPTSRLLVALEAGIVPAAAGLRATVAPALDVAGVLPVAGGVQLELALQAAWARATLSGSEVLIDTFNHRQLLYSYQVIQFSSSAMARARLVPHESLMAPYIGLGAALFRTSAQVAVESLDRHRGEARVGPVATLGLDLRLGPGSVLVELRAAWAPSAVAELEASTVFPFSFSLGYRLWLF
jgi:hypothetical protein